MDKLENLIEWLEERKQAHHDADRNLQQLIGFHEGLETAIKKIKAAKHELPEPPMNEERLRKAWAKLEAKDSEVMPKIEDFYWIVIGPGDSVEEMESFKLGFQLGCEYARLEAGETDEYS